MATKLRIIQIDREEIVIKAATDKVITEAKKAMTAGGVFTVEKKGWVYHIAGQHIIRLEIEQDDDQDDDKA
ncbi:hypothetical protein HNQ07_004653 [Deinococcus metalli]|uniref:Uncharacterized protein n=1 Tax=Deinococcus metalli TaxID=1141878 RepID=A0A7W8KJU5_9DEIO|nr:hypothetical protein [Deinococcus metalli]MBB5379138.1 hypothetical protein [Deinococcus metalli]GHF64962.1 hypothetical protein GCM10017781_45940 [Deinococcus metalli]